MLKPLAAVAVCVSLTFLSACSQEDPDAARATDTSETDTDTSGSSTDDESSSSGKTVECDYPSDGTEAAKEIDPPSASAPAEGTRTVSIATSAGDITATLDAGKTPCTVNNFVSLAEQGWFDATECHRLTLADSGISVLQCGDPTATGMGGPGYTIADEVTGDETYPAGTLAMAKTMMPDSGGSQFFMVYGDSPLPPDYTVFGTIDEAGVKVLQGIADIGTDSGAPDGAPKEKVTIESVTLD
jgi:peptidyl-prolyl cis-trans isomerase B (cyclophilin B)